MLSLPAAPEFVRLARLTCAGLATRVGMGYDEVEDLRIAVGEACSLLIGRGRRRGNLTLTFRLEPDAVRVAVAGTFDAPSDDGAVDADLSDQILEAVVDEHDVDVAGDRVVLCKRHGPPDADGEPRGA